MRGAAMKSGKWAVAALAASCLLAGCGDFWQAPSGGGGGGGGGCTTSCSTTSGGFYILNKGTTSQVAGYTLVSGTLTAMSGSPFAVSAAPTAMAVTPSGASLYVSTADGIFLYPIGTGGALGASSSVSSKAVNAIQVDSTSSWLVEATTTSTGVELDALPIGPTGTAAGSAQTVTATVSGATVEQMAIAPNNNSIFVALGSGGTITIPFNAATKTNTPLGIPGTPLGVKHGGQAVSVAVDPDSRIILIGETLASSNSGGLRVLDYATMQEVDGSPYPSGGATPNAILPGIGSVYVGNSAGASSAGVIAAFNIVTTGSVYSLTAGPTSAAGDNPVGMVQDSSDTYVLDVNSGGSPYFQAYTFDQSTTGKLDPAVSGSTGASPVTIVALPSS